MQLDRDTVLRQLEEFRNYPQSDPITRLQVEQNRVRLGRFRTAAAVLIGVFVLTVVYQIIPIYLFPFYIFPDPIAYYVTLGVFGGIPLAIASIAFAAIVVFILSAIFGRYLLLCPLCKGKTDLLHDWVCGHCDKEHSLLRTCWGHSFVEKCARKTCGNHPHSLICWKCRLPIIWDDPAFNGAPKKSAWLPDSPPLAEAPAKPGISFDERRKRLKIE